MDLVGQLLEYTPTRRLAPLDACVHSYFDELRQPTTRLPNGRPLPPMFNFSAAGIFCSIIIQMNEYNAESSKDCM